MLIPFIPLASRFQYLVEQWLPKSPHGDMCILGTLAVVIKIQHKTNKNEYYLHCGRNSDKIQYRNSKREILKPIQIEVYVKSASELPHFFMMICMYQTPLLPLHVTN
jgi:hypothetical protein